MSDVAHVRYQSYDWDRPFDPNEYRSPKAITMLYESWLQAETSLSKAGEEIENLKKRIGELDKANALLQANLDSFQNRKLIPFALQLIAAICVGIGVNILTAKDNPIYGWLFVGISVVLELVAFFVVK